MEQSNSAMENYNNNSDLERLTNKMLDEIIKKHFDVYQLMYFRNEDLNHVCDITVVTNTFEVIAVGKRVREYKFYNDYKDEFTIRELELHKILNGHGDYIIYGFLSEDKTKIIRYFIIDLKEFRSEYHSSKERPHYNKDGTMFYAFKYWQFNNSVKVYGEGADE